MTALTDAEAAVVARFEAGEPAPESAVEAVARAMVEEGKRHTEAPFPCRCGWVAEFGVGWEERGRKHRSQAVARAALAVMAGPDTTTRAVLALAHRWELAAYDEDASPAVAIWECAAEIRAAVGDRS